jgi:FkbM family methyltransferase
MIFQTKNITEQKKKNSIYTLPNGLKINHLNQGETEFTYNEIFVDKIYLKNGIQVDNTSTVLDIGANIGLFSLFLKQKYPDCKIFSFEPSPELFDILKLNLSQFKDVKIFDYGLSSEEKIGKFTYYPNYSIMSSFFPDEIEDAKQLHAGITNQIQKHNPNYNKKMIDVLVSKKLSQKKELQCKLTTISAIIKQHNIEKIDLVKIDAEKAEFEILHGIEKNDWLKIKQIVMEVHGTDKIKNNIKKKLEDMGFDVLFEQENAESNLSNLFAIKKKNR